MTRHRNSGFTLIEVLVSMAILALLAIYSFSALSSVRRMNTIIDRVQHQENIEIARRFLTAELAGTQAVVMDAGGGRQELLFDGRPASISFVSLSDGSRETGGLYLSTVFLSEEGTLMMSRRLLGRDNVLSPPSRLLDGVKSVRFSYLACQNGGEAGFTAQWADSTRLPFAVAIDVTLNDGLPGRWPKTLVTLSTVAC